MKNIFYKLVTSFQLLAFMFLFSFSSQGATVYLEGAGNFQGNPSFLQNYYDAANCGANATTFNTYLTPAQIAAADVIIIYMPTSNYSASQIAAYNTFLANGGKLVLLGDAASTASAGPLNNLLAGLGSTITVNTDNLLSGCQTLSPITLDNSSCILDGVTSLDLGLASSVNTGANGTAIISSGGTVYAAQEGNIFVFGDSDFFANCFNSPDNPMMADNLACDGGACQAIPNDECDGAITIACNQSVQGSTVGANSDNAPFCGTSNGSGGGLWYTFVGDGQCVRLSTCNAFTNYDSKLRVYTGTCNALNCVAGDDDDFACGFSIFRSTVEFTSVPGQTYYVLVHGFSSSEGNFQLDFTCFPEPPLAVTCPPDLQLPCGANPPPPATTEAAFIAQGGTISGGSCTPSSYTVTVDAQMTGDQCSGIMMQRTYTVTNNASGATETCVQMIEIAQPAPPTVTCPADITVACEDDIMLDPNNATVTTDCGLGSTVYIKNPDAMGAPGCDGTVYTYTYVAVDDCGRQGTCVQTVTIANTPATINAPAGGTVECFEDIDISVNDATVENSCADFNLYLAPVDINGEIGCPGTTYTYTYRVVDVCGNTIEEDVVFTNGANAGPSIEAPADITCECFAGVNPNPDLATVTTACNNGVGSTVEVSGPQIVGPMDCPGTRYIYTYTVTDACGRTATDQQTFTINNGPPVFQNCPDDNWLVLNCEDYGGEAGTIAVIEAWIASVTATNSCGMGLTVFNNFNSNNIGTCINDGYTTVTFRATDNCGRTSFCTGTVVVIDTEAPMIVEEAQDHYEVCNYLTQDNLDDWVDANGGAIAFDGCSNEQVFWSTIPNNPTINCTGQMGTTEVTVTFVARDNCGNKSETTATFYALMASNDLVQDEGPADLNNEVSGLTLDQNRPNPFKDETLISFSLPEATSATLTIFDINGRLLKSFEGDYAAGYNEVSINKSELGATGVMYYQLVTDHGSVTKTMLVME